MNICLYDQQVNNRGRSVNRALEWALLINKNLLNRAHQQELANKSLQTRDDNDFFQAWAG
ncbi:hypothetical protein GCM10011350_36810 [Marinomonas arctica]|nr:hypothetical protein GCM10011350_36810 [Marinomonas arctica]